jgi:hypothetical protein
LALLSATFDKGQIGRALDDEVRALSRRMRAATEKAGREMLLDPLRQATRDALNSRKLPTTWRAAVYPKDDAITLSPAFFVYSKAPKIIAAFAQGATIRPTGGGRYLWIPTENVPRTPGGGRMKPKDVAARVGPFIFRPSKNGGLVALAAASKSRTRAHRRGGETRRGGALKIKRGGELTAFFILKPQVTLRKRLDLDAIATRAGASYRIALQSAANNS